MQPLTGKAEALHNNLKGERNGRKRLHLGLHESICLFHYVFKMALIQGQLVNWRVADLLAAISTSLSSACSVAAFRESKTRFAK